MRSSASTIVTLHAELGEGHAELEPDIAGADDGERLRQLGQRQRLGRRKNIAAERQRGERRRRRAGGDNEVLAADALLAGVGVDDRASCRR